MNAFFKTKLNIFYFLKQKSEIRVGFWNSNVELTKGVRHFSEVDFVDFLSFSLGTPFLQSDLQLFTRNDVFQTQKANVLFVLDASDDDIPFNQFQKITINQKYYPQDSVATLTTLITGYSPSDHGIVAKHWASPNGGFVSF